jgi:nitrite reductase/ring-hydroxylating ferredoxin subunit
MVGFRRREQRVPTFIKIANVSELAPGQAKRVDIAGRSIAVFNVDGRYHAIDDTCNHRGGPLSEGQVDGDAVVCPWHGAKFSVVSGALLGPPGRGPVNSYPTQVNGQDVEIAI